MFSELRALPNMVSVLCSPCCTFAHQPVGAGRGTRDRRVRPPGGAEAVAGRSHRADNVPRRCVVSGDWLGSLCVVRRCSDVCTPPERGGRTGPNYTVQARQFTSGAAFFGSTSAHGHPYASLKCHDTRGGVSRSPRADRRPVFMLWRWGGFVVCGVLRRRIQLEALI
jgi:hypothetical protein